jgi:hypothetical protein
MLAPYRQKDEVLDHPVYESWIVNLHGASSHPGEQHLLANYRNWDTVGHR